MEGEKSMKITTRKQFETIVEFMLQNSSIAKGLKFAENYNINRGKYEEKWQQLTIKVNSLGPPIRDAAGWQKVWTDYKLKLKKKLAHNKKELNSTGGGMFKLAQLSLLEEQVVNLLSLDKAVPINAASFGVENNIESMAEDVNETEEVHQDASNKISLKRSRSEVKDYKKDMLSQQTEALNKIVKLLTSTNKYIKRLSDATEKQNSIYEKVGKKKESEIERRMEIMELEKKKITLEIAKME